MTSPLGPMTVEKPKVAIRGRVPAPTNRTPLLRPIAATLLATVVVGTLASVYVTNADLTTFRSRIPASQLNRWELGSKAGGHAFPVPSLPYFADKVSPRRATELYR